MQFCLPIEIESSHMFFSKEEEFLLIGGRKEEKDESIIYRVGIDMNRPEILFLEPLQGQLKHTRSLLSSIKMDDQYLLLFGGSETITEIIDIEKMQEPEDLEVKLIA